MTETAEGNGTNPEHRLAKAIASSLERGVSPGSQLLDGPPSESEGAARELLPEQEKALALTTAMQAQERIQREYAMVYSNRF